MRIAAVVTLWHRRALAGVVLRHMARMREELRPAIDLVLVAMASNDEDAALATASGWRAVDAENDPLGRKWSEGVTFARAESPDAVVILGSDDLIHADVLRFYARRLAEDPSPRLLGLRDAYVYRPADERAAHWTGYPAGTPRAGESCGAGRCLPRSLLDALDWQPWDLALNKGLDASMRRRISALPIGLREETVPMAEAGPIVDVKHDHEGVGIGSWGSMQDHAVAVDAAVALARFPVETLRDLAVSCDLVAHLTRVWQPCATPVISAAMIVRDEAPRLERCLRSLVGVVDEVVCVDTGSTDRTMEIARTMGARVIEEPWRDDFSAARNVSLGACRGKWRLVIDADEWISDPGDLRDFLLSDPPVDAVLLDVTIHGSSTVRHQTPRVLGPQGWYEFPVHNVPRGYVKLATPVAAIETSNVGREPGKCERSLRLLHAMLDDPRWPDHPHAPYYLAQTYGTLGRWAECADWATECLRRAPDAPEYALAWLLLGQARISLGGPGALQAADDAFTAGLAKHPDLLDLRIMRLSLDCARAYGAARRPGPYAFVAQTGYGIALALPRLCREAGLPVRFGRGEA